MRHNCTRAAFALMLIGILAGCSGSGDQARTAGDAIYYFGGRLISGDGSPPIDDVAFIVENGRFTTIGRNGEVTPPIGAPRVELDGYTLMPVLMNLHGHVGINNGATAGAENYTYESILQDLNRYYYYGISAVASLGTDTGDLAFQIRDEQREGRTGGAQLFTAGRGITVRGGWPVSILGDIPLQVGTVAEARSAVADLAGQEVDFVKIWVDDNMGRAPKMGPEIFRAIIDEAHKTDLRVVAHVFYLADAKELVRAGVDGLVHSIRDREVDDELIAMMKEQNVFYTPTLTAHEARFVFAERPSWLGEQTMREIYPAQVAAYLADPIIANRYRRDPDTPRYREQYGVAQRNLKAMADAGVTIGLGTDTGASGTYPGYFEHRELELMAAAGMAPLDVITAATSVSATLLGIEDRGILAPGKRADFFVLSRDPLEDLKNTREIATIYKNGQQMDRALIPQNLTWQVPRVTDQDRAADAAAARAEAEAAARARLEHFGRWPLGPSANVRGLAVPTPLESRFDVQAGPPDQIRVSISGTGAQLREFYARALPRYQWQAAGNCWERVSRINNRTQVLCLDTATANTAVIQITER